MPALKWDEDLNVGVKAIDIEHHQLALILGRLLRGLTGACNVDLAKNLEALAEKTASHFSQEEHLLRLTDFPQSGAHEREHVGFLKRIFEIQAGFHAGHAGALTASAVEELRDWLEQHIKNSDKAFSSYLNLRGIR
jgi:hemerythrin